MAIVARPIIMQTNERSSRDLIFSEKKFAFRQAFEGGLFVVVNFYHDKVNDCQVTNSGKPSYNE